MKRRIIATLMVIGSISGCVSTNEGPEMGGMRPNYGQAFGPPMVPGVKGPYGEGVPMAAPYDRLPPGSQAAGQPWNSVPMSMVQMHPNGTMTPPGIVNMPGTMPGVPGMPGMPGGMMPGGMPGGMPMMPGGMPGGMMPGGMMPGGMPPGGNPFLKTSMTNSMPDGGVMNANVPPGGTGPGGLTPTQFTSSPTGPQFPAQRTQVYFAKPAGMKIFWIAQGADGKPTYSPTPLETPGRYNFAQAAIYRLKLEKLPGRPGQELYPTLEVVPTSPKTNEFLAHNSVPVEFTEEDFKQVFDRNYIVKVIYLPDPQFQDAAGAGPDEIVSTRLEPGQDPIQEALRRGSILLVLRIGNIDQGLQHSPGMTAPVPGGPPMLMKPPDQGVPPNMQVPFPIPPITPGGVGGPPNTLPPLPGSPPLVNLPKLPAPPVAKPELVPEPNKKEAEKLVIPPLNIPAPPNVKPDDAARPILPALPPLPPELAPRITAPPEFAPKNIAPPVPIPADMNNKGAGNVTPTVPVLPTSSSSGPRTTTPPQTPLITLPALPAVDTTTVPGRPDLPAIPVLPGGGTK